MPQYITEKEGVILLINSTVIMQLQSSDYNFAPIYQDWEYQSFLGKPKFEPQRFAHNILLVYFDIMLGPCLFLSIPNEIDEKITEIGMKLMDLNFDCLEDSFSQFSINNVFTFNRHFYIPSSNRSGTDSILLSFVIKEPNDSMSFKAHRFVEAVRNYSNRFVEAIQTEPDIFKGFLGCENRISQTNYQNLGISLFLDYNDIIRKYEIINYYLRRFESNCIKYLIEQKIEPFNEKYYLLGLKNRL